MTDGRSPALSAERVSIGIEELKARHGTAHMRAIGTAGAQVTIQRHGLAFFQGIVKAKGWHGRRPVSLAVDLAAGRVDVVWRCHVLANGPKTFARTVTPGGAGDTY